MTTRRATPDRRVSGDVLVIAVFGVVAAVISVAYGSWWAAVQLGEEGLPENPWAAFTNLDSWPALAIVFTVVSETALVAAAAMLGLHLIRGHEVDRRGAVMVSPRRLREVAGEQARAKATRLRPDIAIRAPGDIGIELGRTVIGDEPLYMSWEDVGICFGGPRTGKTASVAIAAICSAPGPVIATSNKRDLHDHCRGVREQSGRVWVSDLQGRCGNPTQDWWWNILEGIDRLPAARRLTGYFQSAEAIADAKSDNYFEGGAAELVSLYLLAAAVGGGDIMHSYAWLSEDGDQTAAAILEDHGHLIAATKLRTAQALNARQRDGLYDMGRRMLSVLTDDTYARTVIPPDRVQFDADTTALSAWTPHGHDVPRRQFRPEEFITSHDGLFLMSKEGADSATALVTALVGRILDHALTAATRSPGGRLRTPLVGVLDEAANVCKLRELPYLYSHLGSQGIVLLTFLQSPAQASEVWTSNQLDQLVAASNCHIYAGGVPDTKYLQSIADQIGDHDVERWSVSTGRGGASKSQSWTREPTLPVQLLASLPKDRAIVLSTGNAPVLVRKVPWTHTRHADAIRASLARYEPTGKEVIAL
ncbi:TraM recognition domain-containing protein [Nocardia sp. NPDC052001]|uniref:type IV secretory system conjugative DNA transfer family protein n=1 Tax=Nocardia sp. NPDC052001 TaxID=3154853 RepID=UPI003428B1F2